MIGNQKRFGTVAFLLFLWGSGFAAYDAGDLVNSVKRSQMVTDIFRERWAVMENSFSASELDEKPLQERFYYVTRGGYAKFLDLYFKYEEFSGFPVRMRYFNKTYDLDLRRMALSGILKFEDLVDFGLFQWGFAVSNTGYRYGMTATVDLPVNPAFSGTSSQTFQSTDYVYSQVYDDLIVLTQILKPLGYLHTGLLINKDVDPGIDGVLGTKDYGETSETAYRIFLDSNLFSAFSLNLGYDSKNRRTEFFSTRIQLTDLMGLLTSWVDRRYLWPDLFLGYAYQNREIQNEQASVLTQKPKALQTLFMEINYNYYNVLTLKSRGEIFLAGKDEFEENETVKQFYVELGYSGRSVNRIVKDPEKYYQSAWNKHFSYYFIFGISYLSDSRFLNFGNLEVSQWGYCFGVNLNYSQFLGGIGLDLRVSRNYSPKLYSLIEAYDTWVGEISVQLGF